MKPVEGSYYILRFFVPEGVSPDRGSRHAVIIRAKDDAAAKTLADTYVSKHRDNTAGRAYITALFQYPA